MSSAWEAGRTSRRKARQRSIAPGASSCRRWRTGHQGQREGHRGAGLQHVEQRQVGGGDRLPEPLLARRAKCRSLPRQGGGSAERGQPAVLVIAQHGDESPAHRPRPAAAAGRSRSRVGGRSGRRRVGHAAARHGPDPSPRAPAVGAQASGVEEAIELDEPRECRTGRGTPPRGPRGARLSERSAPGRRRQKRWGSTTSDPSAGLQHALMFRARLGVLDVLDGLQEGGRRRTTPRGSTRLRTKRRLGAR